MPMNTEGPEIQKAGGPEGRQTGGPAGDAPQLSASEMTKEIASRRPVYQPPNRRVKPKIGRNVLGCFLYVLFVLAVFAAMIMVAVAKSGIFPVPIISQYYYTGPKPTHTVNAGEERPEQLLGAIRSAIGSQEGNINIRVPHRVLYTEMELSASARGALSEAQKRGEVDVDSVQVVIREDAVQLTGRFRVKGIMLDAQIEILPTVTDGTLKINITKARFGDIPVAPSLAKFALDSALGRDSNTWNLQIAEHNIQSIRLEDRALELTLY